VFTFDITPDGGETTRVVATSRDVSHWERTGKGRSIAALDRDARMSQLEEIAYLASVRHGAFVGTIAEFREGVDIVPIDTRKQDDGEEDDESGPTRLAR
jgi:hypothetical protein